MAHFCQLDENNVVTQVIVVANSDTADASGVEKEHIGAAFCEKLLGGTWKQTSYNGSIRKNYESLLPRVAAGPRCAENPLKSTICARLASIALGAPRSMDRGPRANGFAFLQSPHRTSSHLLCHIATANASRAARHGPRASPIGQPIAANASRDAGQIH
jgi:hypothetical protein